MRFFYLLLPFIGTALAVQPILFHGTSVVIVPSNETSALRNNTIQAANFFCYMGEKGYFSFGWSVPVTSSGNTSHCRPDATSFHWYEHAHFLSYDPHSGTYTYSTQNFPIHAPAHAKPLPLPRKPVKYTIMPLDIGNGEHGQIAVSYIDDEKSGVKVFGAGTREVLKGSECRKALRTLERTLEVWKPDLGFVLEDICGGDGKESSAVR